MPSTTGTAAAANGTMAAPRPAAAAPARAEWQMRVLVVPLVFRFHGGHMGEAVAEVSAGPLRFVDGAPTFTVRNLPARLFFNQADLGGWLIRLGCLLSEENRDDFLGERFQGTGLPREDGRSVAQANADRAAYDAAVHLANFCAAYRLNLDCTRAVVKQVVHLAERGNHPLGHTTLS
ncbi:hypothetical protein I4F81_012229 [Pyropia yezoensis]|uniref:Uncharacterized protein n=1 Tax=Pyropia yezoensis TaxID=2788 RepID=A0ACC3CIW4_PYRYE|nr:hypothetical protein I4F81_012229 [Neopyropia yezoensis]